MLIGAPVFRDGPKDQTSDVQLHIGESRDSGFASIGLRFCADPVDAPRNDESHLEQPGDLGRQNLPLREHEFFGFALPFAIAGRKRVLRGEAVIEDEPRI